MRLLLPLLLALALPAAAVAQPLPIDQTCAEVTGCFPGDDPGFPVTITQPGEYVLTSNLVVLRGFAIATGSGAGVSIDLAGFMIDGRDTYLSRGILGGGSFRNGIIRGVTIGISSPYPVTAEDMDVTALDTPISIQAPLTLRRSRARGGQDLPGVQCTECILEDVYIGIDFSYSVIADHGSFDRVTTTTFSAFRVDGAAIVTDSEIGVFDVGDDSAFIRTIVTCSNVPLIPTSATAGRNTFVEDSTFIGRCQTDFGDGSHIKGSSLDAFRSGSESTIRSNTISTFESGLNEISLGAGSIAEDNAINLASPITAPAWTAIVAADGSQLNRNQIAHVHDGLVCGEDCIITGNTISSYTGTAITLGLTSIFCQNTIDGSGVAGIVGGIACDAAGVPALTPLGASILTLVLATATALFRQSLRAERSELAPVL